MKICLTANSGGHLNEILQIRKFLKNHDVFYITDKTKMTEAIKKHEKVYFVQKFIIRELIRKLKIIAPILNLLQSMKIYFKEKPNLIITTGAGTSFGIWLVGKVLGIKTIFIESTARVNLPSTFGNFVGRRSSTVLVQWENVKRFYPNSIYAGLIFNINNKPKLKKEKITNIFITAGTYKIPFDRIFKAIDEIPVEYNLNVKAQIGVSNYIPSNYSFYKYADQSTVHADMEAADLIICQAGAGSIFDSLMLGKKVIAVPRLVKYQEFFDDHQKELAGNLGKEGILIYLENTDNLIEAIEDSEGFIPDFQKLLSDDFLFKRILNDII